MSSSADRNSPRRSITPWVIDRKRSRSRSRRSSRFDGCVVSCCASANPTVDRQDDGGPAAATAWAASFIPAPAPNPPPASPAAAADVDEPPIVNHPSHHHGPPLWESGKPGANTRICAMKYRHDHTSTGPPLLRDRRDAIYLFFPRILSGRG